MSNQAGDHPWRTGLPGRRWRLRLRTLRTAEADRRRHQARLEAILAAIPDVVVEYDAAGRIVWANKAALDVAGFPQLNFTVEQAIRTLRFRSLDGAPMVPERAPTRRALGGEQVRGEVYAISTADGRDRVVSAYAAPLVEDGAITGVVALWHDITDLHAAQAAHRTEAARKDEFLALLGHELRNPLVPIGNAVYLIRRAGGNQALVDQACGIAENQLRHITRLVDDLLDVSRIARGKIQLKRERIDLAELVRGVIQDYRPVFAERQLPLEEDLPGAPVPIHADRARIVQAVSNLLHNAMKFSDSGCPVRVAVDRPEAEWARVVVADGGLGIPPGSLQSIFEPFTQRQETLARTQGGLGLGLALVKGLAERHGGSVMAASDGPGRGSTFSIRLPVAPGIEAPGPASAQAGPAAVASRRILVVEDHPEVALTLRLVLEGAGHTVAMAGDGRGALALAASFQPELVLCDLGLPGGLDGHGVARILGATPGFGGVPLVALSGFGSAVDKARALQAGFRAHLTKPVDPDQLVRMVAELA